jgi:glucosamine--fructose-6-phosphate aminotransferase (isomerizing)
MCGIFGIVINNEEDNIYNYIINGLIQLQNRGYDSAGLCVLSGIEKKFNLYKYSSINNEDALIKLKNLKLENKDKSSIGIGHNRWATHGIINDINSHPHLSNNKKFAIVHNGIIENYLELKKKLIDKGYNFISQTDTEIIVNLIDYYYNELKNKEKLVIDTRNLGIEINYIFESIKLVINELKGTYGLLISSIETPDVLFCVRNGSPLLIGSNDDLVIITSETSGFCGMIKNYITLQANDICIIKKTKNILPNVLNKDIKEVIINIHTLYNYNKKDITNIKNDLTPGKYPHWTLKEIYEQPNIIKSTLNFGGRIKNKYDVKLGGLEEHKEQLKKVNNIILLGCGTSYYSSLYGRYYLKQLCNFNIVEVFDGADFSILDIPKKGKTAIILVSQSGETKDLYNCLNIIKEYNKNSIITIGVINVVDSLISREVDCGVYCNAGQEIGVASTKSFISQVVCLSMISLWFSKLQNINSKLRLNYIKDLNNLSNDISMTLENIGIKIEKIAEDFKYNNLFILGKGSDEFIAKEGSLKIKELTYIHSEGYSSSSLKHGPFALLNKDFPVILLNLEQIHNDKIMNCYEEIKSREAPIILISNNPNKYEVLFSNKNFKEDIIGNVEDFLKNNDKCIIIPENRSYASLLGIIPLQLLAYYVSINRGINPDKPKNLAKVVSVD